MPPGLPFYGVLCRNAPEIALTYRNFLCPVISEWWPDPPPLGLPTDHSAGDLPSKTLVCEGPNIAQRGTSLRQKTLITRDDALPDRDQVANFPDDQSDASAEKQQTEYEGFRQLQPSAPHSARCLFNAGPILGRALRLQHHFKIGG